MGVQFFLSIGSSVDDSACRICPSVNVKAEINVEKGQPDAEDRSAACTMPNGWFLACSSRQHSTPTQTVVLIHLRSCRLRHVATGPERDLGLDARADNAGPQRSATEEGALCRDRGRLTPDRQGHMLSETARRTRNHALHDIAVACCGYDDSGQWALYE